MIRVLLPIALPACALVLGCQSGGERHAAPVPQLPAPLHVEGTAYELAGARALPTLEPEHEQGLENVFQLSRSILTGSEPGDQEALSAVVAMGVRTVISVDGKAPDVATAEELGLRYVHVPIQYSGITPDQVQQLAKTFRELDGPFYVHCFHGRHRGPAAAAIGRVVLDGIDRWQAIGEMRQYGGTAAKYEGLYRTIATAELPTAEESAAYDFGFDPAHRPDGVVGTMVAMARAKDNAAALELHGWTVDPEHPDLDAVSEATVLLEAFEAACELDEVREGPEDFRTWFEASRAESRGLVEALERVRSGDSAAADEASDRFAAVTKLCGSCHTAYRN